MCSYGASVIAHASCSMHRFGDQRHLVARQHAARRIVRRVDDDRLRARVERLAQTIGVERPVRPLERNEHRLGAGENRVRTIVLVERLEDDHLVARIHQRHEHRRHRFGRAARHRHVAVRIDLHVVPAPVLLGDRLAKHRRAPRDRVLVDVAVDRRARRLLHRSGIGKSGKSLREIHGLVHGGDARHLADDGFGERRGSSELRALSISILRILPRMRRDGSSSAALHPAFHRRRAPARTARSASAVE